MTNQKTARPRPASGTRCAECQNIKRQRAKALEAGDRSGAEAATVTMGVHLRVAHP
ncbi:hypothetical protein [Streptomyces cinnamoneus]|uniref:hypothetical protein n=1 Tax=Streptomyces cinnamoneus TaxID=53446 RepID=UPI0015E321B7|nr:hypothetical protein [Streptomyces cinnamoneus]